MGNQVIVSQNGYFSDKNSSTTPLTTGATYTGEWEKADDYAAVVAFCSSDESSATDGAIIQTSQDGVNVTSSLAHTVTSTQSLFRVLSGASRYYRIKYTNGATDQGTFQAYLKFSKEPVNPLSSTITQTLTDNSDVTFSRQANDFLYDVALGRVAGHSYIHKFASNATVGTTEELLWNNSGTFSGFMTSATTVRIKSGGNVNDTAAGTGAQSVTIEGLDASFNEISETVATAGTSASAATTASFIRVTRAYVANTGTYSTSLNGSNVGAIVIEDSGGAGNIAQIGAQVGQTELGIYTVPAGKTLHISRVEATTAGNKPGTVRMYQRQNADDVTTPFTSRRLVGVWHEIDGNAVAEYNSSVSFPAKTDIWFTGESASGSTLVAARLFGILSDD